MKKYFILEGIALGLFGLLGLSLRNLESTLPQLHLIYLFLFFALMILSFVLVPAIILLKAKDRLFLPLFHYQGRLNRRNFWIGLSFFAVSSVLVANGYDGATSNTSMGAIVMIAVLIGSFMVSISVRRLHDIGLSQWWLILALVPIANIVLLFLLLFKEGNKEQNRYGNLPTKKVLFPADLFSSS